MPLLTAQPPPEHHKRFPCPPRGARGDRHCAHAFTYRALQIELSRCELEEILHPSPTKTRGARRPAHQSRLSFSFVIHLQISPRLAGATLPNKIVNQSIHLLRMALNVTGQATSIVLDCRLNELSAHKYGRASQTAPCPTRGPAQTRPGRVPGWRGGVPPPPRW